MPCLFKGRDKEQRTLTRLIADLEEEANKEAAGCGQRDKVATMFKATMANDKIMAMLQASRNARMTDDDESTCTRCGGRHHVQKCTFRGSCFECGMRGTRQVGAVLNNLSGRNRRHNQLRVAKIRRRTFDFKVASSTSASTGSWS